MVSAEEVFKGPTIRRLKLKFVLQLERWKIT